MGGIFSLDNPLMQGINKIIDCIFLSILWVLFSFPLITFGAATSALYYTANKTIRNGRGYIWQQFWRGFKSSFKQSTIATLIFAVIALILYNDAKIVGIMFEGIILDIRGTGIFLCTACCTRTCCDVYVPLYCQIFRTV